MTSHGFIHSLLGMTDTLVHVHLGLGSTGTHGAPSHFPQSLFLIPLLLFSCLCCLCCGAIGLGVSRAPAVTSLTKIVRAVSVERPLPFAF